MVKQLVGCQGSSCSQGASRYQIHPASCGNKQHQQVSDKENQGASQILGQHQNQNMSARHGRCQENGFEIRGLIEHGRHKKHKGQLHKFRRLDGYPCYGKGQLGAEALVSGSPYHKKNQEPCPRIYPLKLIKLPYPLHDIGHQPGQGRGYDHNGKLAQGLVQALCHGQPGKHDKAHA